MERKGGNQNFNRFLFLDSESEDEETKNKQLMTSKLAKTLDELCTKVRMSHLFSPRNRKLSLFTNKKKDCIKLHKLFHHTHFFFVTFFK